MADKNKNKPKILIVKTGSTYQELRTQLGDFDQWIRQAVNDNQINWTTQKMADVIPEKVDQWNGLILTGAHTSLTQTYPHFDGIQRMLENIIEHKIPTFGICFGHQLIHAALGGKVLRNPLGMEIGVSTVQLTVEGMADPYFHADQPGKMAVYQSHVDMVLDVVRGVTPLAWNEFSPYQATRYKHFIYTVQFHPEFFKPIMAYYIKVNRRLIQQEHQHNPLQVPHPDKILKGNRQLRQCNIPLKNFIKLVKEMM